MLVVRGGAFALLAKTVIVKMGTNDECNSDRQEGIFKPGKELFEYKKYEPYTKDQNRSKGAVVFNKAMK